MVEELVVQDEAVAARPVRARWHIVTLLAILALVAGAVALVDGDSVPKPATVTNVDDRQPAIDGAGSFIGQLAGFGAPTRAQVNPSGLISQIVCPVLSALASGPFGAFIAGIINALRVRFGCASA